MKWQTGSTTNITVQTVVTRFNEDEIAEISSMAQMSGADSFIVKTVNPSRFSRYFDNEQVPVNPNLRRYEYLPNSWERERTVLHCSRIWHMANIQSDGDVVPCCNDYDSSMKIGNVFETSLTEIWNSTEYRELRKKIFTEPDTLEKCFHCPDHFQLRNDSYFVKECCWKNSHVLNDNQIELMNAGDKIKAYENLLLDMRIQLTTNNRTLRNLEKVYSSRSWRVTRPLRALRKVSRMIHDKKGTKNGRSELWLRKSILKPKESHSRDKQQSCIVQTPFPLPEDQGNGWKSKHLLRTTIKDKIAVECHMSVLSPGLVPHPLHSHKEEEILILLSGQANAIWQDGTSKQEQKVKMCQESCVYYPAGFTHTIYNPTAFPIQYLMFKWHPMHLNDCHEYKLPVAENGNGDENVLRNTVTDFRLKTAQHLRRGVTSRCSEKLFEGATEYLDKLRCHFTMLPSGHGYDPHSDPYDVFILTVAGTVKTVDSVVAPYSLVYYPAGVPHGMRNIGESEAWYLVFELHR
jgi:radical SAM protein with 4Fe4S-binding SPASM domain